MGFTLQEDFQTVCRLNPNYPDGFFKLIDLLAAVDDVGGDDVGQHEDVVEEEEVLGLQPPPGLLLHPKHSLSKEVPVAVDEGLVAWTEGVLDHLHSVACLLLMWGY